MAQFLLYAMIGYLSICYLWGLYVAARLLRLGRISRRPVLTAERVVAINDDDEPPSMAAA